MADVDRAATEARWWLSRLASTDADAAAGARHVRALLAVERLQRRCDDRAPGLPSTPPTFCARYHGHGGWHEAEAVDGMPPMRWLEEAPSFRVSDQTIETAAQAAFQRWAATGLHSATLGDVMRKGLEAALPSLVSMIRADLAVQIEAMRDGPTDEHYEMCSLTQVADWLRSGS